MSQSEKRYYSKHFVSYSRIFAFIPKNKQKQKNRKHSASCFWIQKRLLPAGIASGKGKSLIFYSCTS